MNIEGCPFCQIALTDIKNQVLYRFTRQHIPQLKVTDVIVFEPLNPIVDGKKHLLVVPCEHSDNFKTNPQISADVMYVASTLANALFEDCNLIVNSGKNASQTVFHTHVHLIERSEGDGIVLPWTNQKRE